MVQEARDKATKSLNDIVKIKEMIQEAEAKSHQVHGILEQSERNANAARNITQMAQQNAVNASNSANEIRQEAAKTKIEVIKLGSEADKLYQRVNTTDSMIREHELRIQQEANVTAEVIFTFRFETSLQQF